MSYDNENEDEELIRKSFIKITELEEELAVQKEPIAIIGMSCRFPGEGNTIHSFWNALREGSDCIVEVPENRFNVEEYYDPDPSVPGKMSTKYGGFLTGSIDEFDAQFFSISPKEAEYLDPQQRLLMEVTWEALENAGIAPKSLSGTKTGVFVGICSNDYRNLILESGDKEGITTYLTTGSTHSTATGRISFFLDLKGPNFAVDTACSSSLVAVDSACQSLLTGNSNLALAGGVNLILSPDLTIDFSQAGMLAPDGHCKTFDATANGYVRSEGCGMVVLKRLSDAQRDGDSILAVIRASGINQDGSSSGLTVPNGESQVELIQDVTAKAGINPSEIDYIEAHGTGTPLGDPIEVRALAATYGVRSKEHPLYLGSVKTNIGHTEGASGIAGLIKTVLALKNEQIPAHLHFKTLNPQIDWDFPGEIVTKNREWKRGERKRLAAVSSFGFSGTNAHVIVEEAPVVDQVKNENERPLHLLTLSAKSPEALDELIENYRTYLAATKETLSDIAYTANTGRNHFKYRASIIATDVSDLKTKLQNGKYTLGNGSKALNIRFEYIETDESMVISEKENLIVIKLGPKTDWKILFDKLLSLYIDGANIDWKALEAPYIRRKVNLPTYPFQRERYWTESATVGQSKVEKGVHPLLGLRVSMPDGGVDFVGKLHLNRLSYLKDHTVYQNVIFPATGYLEMMGFGSQLITEGTPFRVNNISIQEALTFSKGEEVCTQVMFAPQEDNSYTVSIYTEGENQTWRTHASGELSLLDVQAAERIDIEALKKRCSHSVEKFYDDVNQSGIHYGPAFQTVQSLFVGENEAYGELQLSDSAKGYMVHPALLDGCLQLLFGLSKTPEVYLPIGCDAFSVYRSVGEQTFAQLILKEDRNDVKIADIILFDEIGQVSAKIEGLHCKRTNEASLKRVLAQGVSIDDWLYEWIWEEKEVVDPVTFENPGQWLVVGAGEKITSRLQEKGAKCHQVETGSKDTFTSRFKEIKELSGVIYLAKEIDYESASREDFQEVLSLVFLAQAMIEEGINVPLYIVDSNGMLGALHRTIVQELPELKIKSISGNQDEVIEELFVDDDEEFVSYKNDMRCVGRLVRETKAGIARGELSRPENDQFRLGCYEKGLLENLRLQPLETFEALESDQVEVEVRAAGLNFRDVLDALGVSLGVPAQLGGDGAGIVTAVGEDVSEFSVGDAVFGLMPGSLARKTIVHKDTIVKKGDAISFEEASSLPTIFLTAHYALNHLTKMKQGERVLIHAGAGGVGQAAIQLAKKAGVEIFATAGNDEKRKFLKEQGVDHVLDSRSLSYGNKIEKLTNGEGVDIVLNCLSSEGFIETTIGICGKGARFLEIGKRDIWSHDEMHKARPDIDYHVIALDDIMANEPTKIKPLLKELVPLFESFEFKPVPITQFPIEQSIKAFSYMRDAKQIGKIVIAIPPKEELKPQFDSSACYLITGGLGGIGLTLARWLSENGAGILILTGRSEPKEEAKQKIKEIEAKGIKVFVEAVDISNKTEVTKLIEKIHTKKTPLKGVFHLAGVLDDAPFLSQNAAHFEKVFAPKVYGSLNLHALTQKMGVDLDYFILFSSASATLGSPGQSNYATANCFMDRLAKHRRTLELPAQSLAWGLWGKVGMATKFSSHLNKSGIISIDPQVGMRAFEEALVLNQSNITIAPIDWKRYLHSMIHIPSWLSDFSKGVKVEGVLKDLEGLDSFEQSEYLKAYITKVVKEVIGIKASRSIDENKGFFAMGFNSLLTLELHNRLQAAIGTSTRLAKTAIIDFPTVNKLNNYIMKLLNLKVGVTEKKEKVLIQKVSPDEPIAIIGLSCRFPGEAVNVQGYWNVLSEGKDCIREIPKNRWDVEEYYDPIPLTPGKMVTRYAGFLKGSVKEFDANFFGISPREAEYLDPQQRLLLEVTWEAIENAGIAPHTLSGTATGVYTGICSSDYSNLILEHSDKENIVAYSATGSAHSTATGRISFFLDLKGPNLAVDTACSSSLVAVDAACQSLLAGNSNLALAGGVNLILSPDLMINFSQAGMLTPDGCCKTFDAAANGYVRGEGCGVVVLKRLSDAQRDGDSILALIRASGVNQDGSSSGLTVPNGESQTELLEDVTCKARIKPSEVDYVEAHGTATSLGDPIEVRALAAIYGVRNKNHPLYLGSVKTNIGHLEGAAGIAGIIKTVLALKNENIPAHLHFKTLNPEIDWNFPGEIVTKNKEWKRGDRKRFAAVSSFGFSGTNAHIIIEEAPLVVEVKNENERPLHLLTLSAKSPEALEELIENYQTYLATTKEALSNIVYTANTGRDHFKYRASIIAEDVLDLKAKLQDGKYALGSGDKALSVRFEHAKTGGFSASSEKKNLIVMKIGPKTDWQELFDKLLILYIDGADIDWKALETPYVRRKVSLPSYPFQRERYWSEFATVGQSKVEKGVHPLLGIRVSMPDGGVDFVGKLHLNRLSYLKDHKVYQNVIFPAAGYLEMMGFGSQLITEGTPFRVNNISIQEALTFSKSKEVDTQVMFVPQEDNTYTISIYTEGENQSFRTHVSGELSLHDEQLPEKIDVEALKESCCHPVENFYNFVNQSGIHYGEAFQTVKSIHKGENEVYGELQLSDSAKGYMVHPALLDGCLQLLFGLSETSDIYLPIGCDTFSVYSPVGEHTFAHLILKENRDDIKIADIVLFDEIGQVSAKIEGLHYKRTNEASLKKMLAKGLSVDDWFYEWNWEESQVEEVKVSAEPGEWLIVGAGDRIISRLQEKGAVCHKDKLKELPNLSGVIYCLEENTFESVSRKSIKEIEAFVSLAQNMIKENGDIPLYIVKQSSSFNVLESSFAALQKTIMLEHPEFRMKMISGDTKEILNELYIEDKEAFVSYNEGERLVGRLIRESKAKTIRHELTRPDDDQFRLKSREKGLLENLELATLEPPEPLEPHQVEVDVRAVGLNFRDVLDALGLYPGDPGPMGGDGSGVVTAVGDKVKAFSVGDSVFGLMSGALARRAVADENILVKKEEGLTFSDAAALPTVFLTAHYALNHLAKMKKGEKVLIHAGAGGVGQAAIQLAKIAGVEIFSTAGNDEKRKFLKDQGVDHVLDSRSLSYGEEISKLTNGKGVDIVLNCLSGEGFIDTTIRQCAQEARFLEIGKRDIWSQDEMRKVRPDIDYHIIALDNIAVNDPPKIKKLLRELLPLFQSAKLKSLPVTQFPIEQSINAFSYMREAKQIGKIVIAIPPKEELKPQFDASASYLITGGLGGLGLMLANWLSESGAGTLILTGRSKPNEEAKQQIAEIESKGIKVLLEAVDISKKIEVSKLLKRVHTKKTPLKGIFHLAGVLDDAPFLSQDSAHFEKVFAPKVSGSLHLHRITQKMGIKLDHFVLFSSVAALIGSPGQSNYATANAFMDGLAEYRRSQGLPAQSLAWGSWSKVGMAAEFSLRHSKSGIIPIEPAEGIKAIEEALTLGRANVMIAPIDWTRLLKPMIHVPGWLLGLSKGVKAESILDKLAGLDPAAQSDYVKSYIIKIVKDVLGLSAGKILDEEKGFFDIGLDSLMAVELKNRLQSALGDSNKLSSSLVFDYSSVNKLNGHLCNVLNVGPKEEESVSPSSQELEEKEIEEGVELIPDNELRKLLEEEM